VHAAKLPVAFHPGFAEPDVLVVIGVVVDPDEQIEVPAGYEFNFR